MQLPEKLIKSSITLCKVPCIFTFSILLERGRDVKTIRWFWSRDLQHVISVHSVFWKVEAWVKHIQRTFMVRGVWYRILILNSDFLEFKFWFSIWFLVTYLITPTLFLKLFNNDNNNSVLFLSDSELKMWHTVTKHLTHSVYNSKFNFIM